jgi:hypothetical protein
MQALILVEEFNLPPHNFVQKKKLFPYFQINTNAILVPINITATFLHDLSKVIYMWA